MDDSAQKAAGAITKSIDEAARRTESLLGEIRLLGKSAFDNISGSVGTLNAQLTTLNNTLNNVVGNMGKLSASSGGIGSAAAAARSKIDAQAIQQAITDLNLSASGSERSRYSKGGVQTTTAYAGDTGSASVTRDGKGNVTGGTVTDQTALRQRQDEERRAALQIADSQSAMMRELGAVKARTVEAEKLSYQQQAVLERQAAEEIAEQQTALARELTLAKKRAVDADRLSWKQRDQLERQAIAANEAEARAASGRGLAAISTMAKVAAAPFNALTSFWHTVGNQAIRLSALFYSVERIGRGIRGATVGPYEEVVGQVEGAQKFREGISGTVGGMGTAKSIDDSLIKMSRDLPMTLEQLRVVASQLVNTQSLSSQAALSPQSALHATGQLADIVSRLNVANPESNPEEIAKAVDAALLGNLRSLRLVARIDPSDLARAAGVSQKELSANSDLLLRSIQTVAHQRVSDSALADRGNLPSLQIEKIYDQFRIAALRIGEDSSLFTVVTSRFRTMMDELATYVDSPEFRSKAVALGDDLSRIFDNVLKSGASLLRGISGADSTADTPDKVAGQIESILHSISSASDGLPALSASIGNAMGSIESTIDRFLKYITNAGESVDERLARIENFKLGDHSDLFGHGQTNEKDERYAIFDLYMSRMMNKDAVTANQNFEWGHQYRTPEAKDEGDAGFIREAWKQIEAGQYSYRNGDYVSQDKILDTIIRPLMAQYPDVSVPGAATKGQPSVNSRTGVRSANDVMRSALFAGMGNDAVSLAMSPDVSSAASDGNRSVFNGVYRNAGLMDDLLPKTAEKFNVVLKEANGYLDSALGQLKINPDDANEKFGDIFSKARERAGQQANSYDAVRNKLIDYSHETMSAEDRGVIESKIDELTQASDNLRKMTDDSAAAMKVLRDAAQNATLATIAALKAQGGFVEYYAARSASAGDNALQKRVGAGGYGSMSADNQQLLLGYQNSGLSAMAKQNPELYRMLNGTSSSSTAFGRLSRMSSDELAAANQYAVPKGSSLLGGPGTNALELQALQGQMEYDKGNFANAKKNYNELGPDATVKEQESAKIRMLETAKAVADTAKEMQNLELATNTTMGSFVAFGGAAQNSIEKGAGSAIEGLILRTHNLRQAMSSLVNSIVSEWSQMVSKNLFGSLFGSPNGQSGIGNGMGGIAGAGFNGLTGLFNGAGAGAAITADASVGASNALDSLSAGLSAASAAANGAVFRGGLGTPVPFAAFSKGGVVGKPHLALLGERSDAVPEAILPLLGPGGTIPMGVDSRGLHAILPGGRKVGASVSGMSRFADGGIMGGYSSGAAMSGSSRDDSAINLTHMSILVDDRNAAEAKKASLTSQDRNVVVDIITRDLMQGGRTHRAIARGPGH